MYDALAEESVSLPEIIVPPTSTTTPVAPSSIGSPRSSCLIGEIDSYYRLQDELLDPGRLRLRHH
ncbi:MAG: hypothetical protein R2991_04495 [Thermoanaerobaculia bacterium]